MLCCGLYIYLSVFLCPDRSHYVSPVTWATFYGPVDIITSIVHILMRSSVHCLPLRPPNMASTITFLSVKVLAFPCPAFITPEHIGSFASFSTLAPITRNVCKSLRCPHRNPLKFHCRMERELKCNYCCRPVGGKSCETLLFLYWSKCKFGQNKMYLLYN